MSRSRPILFNGPMVRAILDGRKGQFRRPLKPQTRITGWGCIGGQGFGFFGEDPITGGEKIIRCPYGQPGDVLWVRETWNDDWTDHVIYRADGGSAKGAGYDAEPKWRPPSHMPKRACRLRLRITDVRVERLQEISEADMLAEGLTDQMVSDVILRCARRYRTVPEHWIARYDESLSFCRRCAEKQIRKLRCESPEEDYQLDGGWLSESDSWPFCELCGRALDCSFTEGGCASELDHFETYGLLVDSPSDCASLLSILYDIPWEGGKLSLRLREVSFQAFWDSVYAKTDFAWAQNPGVWAVAFERAHS